MKQFFFLLFTLTCLVNVNLEAQTNHRSHSWDDKSAFLGVDSDAVNRKKARILGFDNPHGKMIKKVVKNSAADRAGLQPFDYIYRVNDREFDANYGLSSALRQQNEGDEIVIYFVRQGKNLSKSLELGGTNDRNRGYKSDRNGNERPFLGVSHIMNKDEGVQVSITRNSTAEKLGMNNGDILTEINGNRIVDWGDITTSLRMVNVGDKIEVNYLSDGEKRRKNADISSRNHSNSSFGNSMEGFEESMERFGESMEELGESMEELGETIEENAEEFGEEFEDKVEIWAENFEDRVENIFGKDRNNSKNYNSAFLGINFHRLSAQKARFLGFENRYGSYVEGVIDNTAAANTGLQIFDYIYGIDEYRTGEAQSLGSILHKFEQNQQAEVLFIRNGKKQRRPITFISKSEAQYSNIDECDEAFLGVRQVSKHDVVNKGSVVVNPVENSTAIAIGLKNGDSILKINDFPIYDWTDVATAIDAMTTGENVKVLMNRDGKEYTLTGPIKARRETSTCDEDDSFNFSFDIDMDDDDNEFFNKSPQTEDRVDISDMDVQVEDLTGSDADEMRSKYGVEMPVVSNLQVSQVNVFPNPSMGMFVLKFDLPERGDTAIRIFNSLGREIYNYELSDFTGSFEDNIDISQNGAGSYFLAVTQNGKTMTKKIILQKR